jgi:rhodanese-related sulfurtransferase
VRPATTRDRTLRAPASRSVTRAVVAAALLVSGCGERAADAAASRSAETDSIAAALEAAVAEDRAKHPERYAEEPVPVVEVAEVSALLAEGADVLLVDAREPEAFARGHLPGAVNFPYGNWLQEGKPLPPRDRDLVVYCNSRDCPIGRVWSQQAVERGYTRVRHMKAGFAGWQEAGLDVETGP